MSAKRPTNDLLSKDLLLNHDLKVGWLTEAMTVDVVAIGEAAAAAAAAEQ